MDVSGTRSSVVAATESGGSVRTQLVAIQLEPTRWHVLNVVRRWLDRTQKVRLRAMLRRESHCFGEVVDQQQVTLGIGQVVVDRFVDSHTAEGQALSERADTEARQQARERFAASLVSGAGIRN